MDKLSTADKMILGGGVAYLIFMFFPWYGISVDTGFSTVSYNSSGWDFFLTGILPLILVVVMCAHVIITSFAPDTEIPDPPVPWKHVHTVAGAVAAILVLLRLLISSDDVNGVDVGADLDRKFGLFLALIAVGVVAAGGFMKEDDQAAATGGGGDPGGSAPF